ncbi:SWF or SNF family helicase [Streptomyces sp. NPDC048389]|uniref:SWIM zinc finger family protein n=1 Tax=Streptomyces sp. NPDC048389 TaxID=3154622 RepID=UPI00345712FD
MNTSDGPDRPERTFDALPPARGRGFARTWWGRAWIKALQDTALDGEQLKKGRRHAMRGAVGAVSVRPGRITAVVRDRDGTAYRSDVLLQELGEQEWERFLDMATDRAGHIAALLDRDMPPHLVEDAAAAGVELLPGTGDLEPECTCETWDHCPHTAALCYQVARLLDQDPFILLLMRGRGERRLLDELQLRSVARVKEPAEAGAPAEDAVHRESGVRAEEAFGAGRVLPPLPAPPPLPDEPGPAPALDTPTPPGDGLDTEALEFLVADAAARARLILARALAPGHDGQPVEAVPTRDQDAVRMAASVPGPVIAGRLATGTGRTRAGAELAVRAWRFGRAAGLAALEEDFTPDTAQQARAARALASAWAEAAQADRPRLLRTGPARWTVVGAGTQLRLGPDGQWWPFRKERGGWAPAGPASADPAEALAGARSATG